MIGAGRGLFCCCSSFRSWTSSRFLLATLLTARVVTVGSVMSMGTGGATALAAALALARVLGAVAVKGCSTDGGAGAALGWAGAAFALTSGGVGGATSMPFVFDALSAVTAAEAEAMKAFLPVFFRTPDAADPAEVV